MTYIKQIIITFVAILILIIVIMTQIQINNLSTRVDDLTVERDALVYENEKLKKELEAPMDDEYIAKVAEQELGYKDPNKQYFYNDIPE